MDKLTIQEFGATIKQKYPQYSGISDYELGQKTLAKYPQYSEKVVHTYNVEPVKKQKPSYEQLKQEAGIAQAEAKKAKSVGGFLSNFGKAFVENIAPSEVGLGKTIGKLGGSNIDTYSKIINDINSQQASLLKLIRDKDAQGQDSTKLKKIYNDNVLQLREANRNLQEESNLPSTSKVVGQLGGTALDILSAGTYSKAKTGLMASGKLAPKASTLTEKLATTAGIPEASKIATQKAGGLFTKQGLKNVGIGAGYGYANDVTMGLQGLRGEDRTGGSAFIPGIGTAIGTTIPVASEATQTVKNLRNPELKAEKLIVKREKGLNKLDSYNTLKKAVEKGNERGIDVKKIIAETDILHGAVDKTGNISTKGEGGAIEQYTKQFIDGNENLVSELLKKENRSISPELIKARLIQKVKNAGIEGKALTNALNNIDDEVAGYMLRSGETGNIPVATLHDAKIDKYNNINFFTEGNVKKYDKTIAKALKELVEENTKSVKVKEINNELSKHFAVIDYLNKLDNKKVSGGKLGKYFAQTIGAIVGSKVGGALGGIAGAEVGGGIKGNIMSRAFSGKTGKIQPQAEIIQEALRVKKAPPLELPQSKSNSLGSLKTNQSPTIIPTNTGISNTIQNIKNKVKDIPNKQGGFATGIYKGEKDLTTKILKDLEGKTTVSKQYILDATNRGELKQVERDITRQVLDTMPGDTVNVKEFADKVKAELLPLKVNSSDLYKGSKKSAGYTGNELIEEGNFTPKYENISLPDEVRGKVKTYQENIYESPIATSAGDTHFGYTTKNYFGHTRIEDMADNKTRRVIEVQSDLYQKGNLEREGKRTLNLTTEEIKQALTPKEYKEFIGLKDKYSSSLDIDTKLALERKQSEFLDKAIANNPRTKEVAKLQQYNDPTAHFRMIREEIKKAAQDGKTKLQFPTGETAMKIEGLGEGGREVWAEIIDNGRGGFEEKFLLPENLKVGKEIVFDNTNEWIITDVLGDGKFKAVPKDEYTRWERMMRPEGKPIARDLERLESRKETFDISGKVDTNNPIYKFYEKEVAKYLNKFGGKRIVDDKGVSWIEVPITKEQGKMPVEAFGKIQLGTVGTGALLSGAGVLGASYIKSKRDKK